jgi:hypothetical protein
MTSARYAFYTKTRAEVIEHLLRRDFKLYQGQLCEDCPLEPVYYEQGGVFADAVQAAKRFGVMPEEAYPGFPQGDTELFRRLNALIAELQGRPGQPDQNEIVGRVTALLDHYLGAPPAAFEFEGGRFDARSLFAAVLPGWQEAPALELNYHPGARERRTTVAAFDGARYPALHTGQHARVMSLLDRALKSQRAVLVQYKVVNEERTHHDGHIGFAIHGLPVPRHVDWDSPLVLDHYVLAIGARYSDDGRLLGVFVKNTWGTSPRENYGFHWIEPDYFPLIEAVEVPAGIEP